MRIYLPIESRKKTIDFVPVICLFSNYCNSNYRKNNYFKEETCLV